MEINKNYASKFVMDSNEGALEESTAAIASENMSEDKNNCIFNYFYSGTVETKYNYAMNVTADFPTDHTKIPDMYLITNMKKFIIWNGLCKPHGPFPKDPKQNSR